MNKSVFMSMAMFFLGMTSLSLIPVLMTDAVRLANTIVAILFGLVALMCFVGAGFILFVELNSK